MLEKGTTKLYCFKPTIIKADKRTRENYMRNALLTFFSTFLRTQVCGLLKAQNVLEIHLEIKAKKLQKML